VNGVRDSVLVAEHRLDRRLAREVAEACELLHADYVPLAEHARLDAAREAPLLLVAGLPRGKREIAPDLMDVCTRTYPGLPVLLLCEDQLVQPTVTLKDGRIVMVGPPLTRQRIESRLRLMREERHLRAHEGPASVTSIPDGEQAVWSRERTRADAWLAWLACRSSLAPAGETHKLPLVAQGARSITCVLPCSPVRVPGEAELQLAVAALAGDKSVGERRLRLEVALGQETGVVHLDTRAEEWTLYWPRRDYPLWLHSNERLPEWSDLAALTPRSPMHVYRAFAGDLVVGLTRPPPGWDPTAERDAAELARVMGEGGPALLAHLEERLNDAPIAFAGVLLEAR
jgi:hypothetical protein